MSKRVKDIIKACFLVHETSKRKVKPGNIKKIKAKACQKDLK